MVYPSAVRGGKSMTECISDEPICWRSAAVESTSRFFLRQGDWIRIQTSAREEAGRCQCILVSEGRHGLNAVGYKKISTAGIVIVSKRINYRRLIFFHWDNQVQAFVAG